MAVFRYFNREMAGKEQNIIFYKVGWCKLKR